MAARDADPGQTGWAGLLAAEAEGSSLTVQGSAGGQWRDWERQARNDAEDKS